MADGEMVYRLSDLITTQMNQDINNSLLYTKEIIESSNRDRAIIILKDNLLDKYRQEIIKSRILVSLTAVEKSQFYYQPKLLCHQLYHHTELWKILLEINEMKSVTEFCQEMIYVMSPGTIERIFLEILNLEESTKDQNESELNSNKNDYILYKNLLDS